jgi:hypothetical protein
MKEDKKEDDGHLPDIHQSRVSVEAGDDDPEPEDKEAAEENPDKSEDKSRNKSLDKSRSEEKASKGNLKRGSGVSSLGLDTGKEESEDEEPEEEEVKQVRKRDKKERGKTILRSCPRLVRCINAVLDNKLYIAFMTIVTMYALFVDDIRILLCPKSWDEIFYGITSAALFFFLQELVLSSLAQDGYLLGFYFWLDFVATVSLVGDIGWVWDPIMGAQELSDEGGAQQATQEVAGSQAAGVGT